MYPHKSTFHPLPPHVLKPLFSAIDSSLCSFFESKKEGISKIHTCVNLGVFSGQIEYYTCVISIILLKSSILAGFDGNCLCASKIIRKHKRS
jgi:hypothetical protein